MSFLLLLSACTHDTRRRNAAGEYWKSLAPDVYLLQKDKRKSNKDK